MKKVSTILLMALVLSAVGVNYEAPVKKIASVELPTIEKSYPANVVTETTAIQICNGTITMGVYQDDIYYSETTAVDNYTLPLIEAVYISVPSPVPLIAA